jgi:hypothetical protein
VCYKITIVCYKKYFLKPIDTHAIICYTLNHGEVNHKQRKGIDMKLTLDFELDNATFKNNPMPEVQRIFQDLLTRLQPYSDCWIYNDLNPTETVLVVKNIHRHTIGKMIITT